jgi:hypothetical protein
LVLDVENACSARALRFAIEGKLSVLEPFGSLRDPERRVSRRRLLQALAAAGLLVEDVVDVPVGNDRVGPEFAAAAFTAGFLPTLWIQGSPSPRLWVVASKATARLGTVLVGPGDFEEQQRTIRAVSALLPPDSGDDWEVLACEAEAEAEDRRECAAFARGVVARSKGRVLWFLRAGATVTGSGLPALLARTAISPAVPGDGAGAVAPGDVSGLALAREDALVVGPFDSRWQSDRVAYEDWLLRLDGVSRSPHVVECGLATPPVAAADERVLAAEGQDLLARWGPIGKPPRVAAPRADRVVPWEGRAPRISLVMMVKNEQRFLPECLRRAAPCADEIVVVDTGSTDDTVAIAASFGAKVVRFACATTSPPRATRGSSTRPATGSSCSTPTSSSSRGRKPASARSCATPGSRATTSCSRTSTRAARRSA